MSTRKLWSALALVAIVVSPAAYANCVGVDNCFGVYFDSPAYEQHMLDAAPDAGIPFNLYFVLKNATPASIGGFEFAWRFAQPGAPVHFVLGTTLPAGAVVQGSFVDLPVPLVVDGPVLLTTVQLMITTTPEEAWIQVGPATPPTVPGYAIIQDGMGQPDLFIPLNFPGVVDDEGWATVAGWMIEVPVEPTVWGSLKALYR